MADIASPQTYLHPFARVYTAAKPGVTWERRPYLFVDHLTLVASPAIDQCTLRYDPGEYATREKDAWGDPPALSWFNPLAINRQFVKVELLRKDQANPSNPPTVIFTWYGEIEVTEESLAQKPDTTFNRTGMQRITAYGGARLLEKTYIRQSTVDYEDASPVTIDRGLPFNFQSRTGIGRFGTRSPSKTDGVYLHSYQPNTLRGQELTADDFWTATDAVEYLLKHHRPLDSDFNELCVFEAEAAIPADWYDITVETDRRSVKDVLDELIDRRRMLAYWVYGFENGANFSFKVRVFSFNEAAISLPGGGMIPANTNQQTLFMGSSTIVEQARVASIATHQVDDLIVEGAYITSTGTLHYDENAATDKELKDGWSSTLETEYKAAAGGDEIENTVSRSADRFADVFARFPISADWTGQVAYGDCMGALHYEWQIEQGFLPDANEIADADVATQFEVGAHSRNPWNFLVRHILNYLAIKDEDTGEYRRPFVMFKDGDTQLYTVAENVSALDEERTFNVSTRILADVLGVHLAVNRPGGQQLIAKEHWAGAAATPEELDPTVVSSRPLQYDLDVGAENPGFLLTCTVEWDQKVRVTLRLREATGHNREMIITYPDARLDFELPGTVTDVTETGSLERSTGKVLRDDRERLQAIAEAAAIWYGAERQAAIIPFRDLSMPIETPIGSIGTIITKLYGDADDPINTPVTGIAFDFVGGITTIETAYAEVDFSTFGGRGSDR